MQARQQAMDRLYGLAENKQRFTDQEYLKAEAERKQLEKAQYQQDLNGTRSVYGTLAKGAGMGAGIGTMFGPVGMGVGASVGALGGLILGGAAEAKNRKDLAKLHGKKMTTGQALGKTFGRAPSLDELGQIVGGAAQVGGAYAGSQQTQADAMNAAKREQAQGLRDWRRDSYMAGQYGRGGYGRGPAPTPNQLAMSQNDLDNEYLRNGSKLSTNSYLNDYQ
jgi:hypothetical protein